MRGRRIEYGAWLTGIVLLMVFGAARLWAESERVRGLETLRAAQFASRDRVTAKAERTDADVTSGSLARSGRATAADSSARVTAASRAAIDQTLWSDERAREYAEATGRPGDPAAALRIPSIGLEVPVYPNTNELNLNRGAGHIEGTAPLGADGNVGIAAHRDGFFRALERLQIDADVLLEVGPRTLHYRVVEMRIVKPTDVHVLATTETPSVTLVTCYPFYFVGNAPERYIVRAELVDPADGLAASGRRASAHEP